MKAGRHDRDTATAPRETSICWRRPVADEIDGIAGLLDVSQMGTEERRLRLLAKSSVLQLKARYLVNPHWVELAKD